MLISEALIEFPDEVQLEKAIQLADKFLQKNKKDSAKVVKQKLEQMLIRKGHPYKIIQETFDSLDLSQDQEDELEILRKQGNKLVNKYRNETGYEFTQKMKQALYRKGFSIELIDRFLAELPEEE